MAVDLDRAKCARILEILIKTANRLNKNQQFILTCTPVSDFRFQTTLRMGHIEIDPEHLEMVFEPYSEKFRDSYNLQDGSGFSLTIARGYVDMMNGSVFASLHEDEQFSISVMLPYQYNGSA